LCINENKTKKHRETCKQQFITNTNNSIFNTWSAVGFLGCDGTAITLAKLVHGTANIFSVYKHEYVSMKTKQKNTGKRANNSS
jgi:riboflavin synthase alpha subunit